MSSKVRFVSQCLAFVLLAGLHALLFHFDTALPESLGGAIAFFSWMPMLPLAWLGLPVTMTPLPIPNGLGDVWSIAVWALLYWWLAGAAVRHLGRPNTREATSQ
jgi:hypothetical protein